MSGVSNTARSAGGERVPKVTLLRQNPGQHKRTHSAFLIHLPNNRREVLPIARQRARKSVISQGVVGIVQSAICLKNRPYPVTQKSRDCSSPTYNRGKTPLHATNRQNRPSRYPRKKSRPQVTRYLQHH